MEMEYKTYLYIVHLNNVVELVEAYLFITKFTHYYTIPNHKIPPHYVKVLYNYHLVHHNGKYYYWMDSKNRLKRNLEKTKLICRSIKLNNILLEKKMITKLKIAKQPN